MTFDEISAGGLFVAFVWYILGVVQGYMIARLSEKENEKE